MGEIILTINISKILFIVTIFSFLIQAAIIAHKKENAAEGLRETRDEYSRLMHEVEEKRELAKQASGGGEVLKGDEVCTVKPVKNSHSKIDKTKVLMTNGSLMKVDSIAECSPWSILQYF